MGQPLNEKIFVPVNGLSQGMFLQSENTANPVLLFLHGGPGSPEIAFTQEFPTGLEKLFTVCWWEQRGCGITYRRDTPKESMTIEQMIADAIEVTRYLCRRFGKEKVYVMGHSWGSMLGVLTVQRAPKLFHAYIGVGQVTQQDESERLAYSYMLKEFRAAGNRAMVRKLEKFPINAGGKISTAYLKVRSDGMMKLGVGITRQWRSMAKCAPVILRYRGYTLGEKLNFVRGNAFSIDSLWEAVLYIDLPSQAPRLEVPVYVLHGVYDYQVSYSLAKAYVQALEAPVKGFYSFENSAHSPCFEEPEKVWRILREDVLQNTAS